MLRQLSYLTFIGAALSYAALGLAHDSSELLGTTGPLLVYGDSHSIAFHSDPKLPPIEKSAVVYCSRTNHSVVPKNVRRFFQEQFNYYVERDGSAIGETEAVRFAKSLAMGMCESGGNAANVTDMDQHGSDRSDKLFYRSARWEAGGQMKTTLDVRQSLLNNPAVEVDARLNYGFLQISANQVSYRPEARPLLQNTVKLIASDPQEALERCGTHWFYQDSTADLLDALKEAGDCKAGWEGKGQVRCFGKLLTICPALGLNMSFIVPLRYFDTKNVDPVCVGDFKALLK